MASETLMTALGFSRETSRLYDLLLPMAGRPIEAVARSLAFEPGELRAAAAPLAEFEIVTETDGVLAVLPPADAVSRMLRIAAERARLAHDRLLNISRAMPHLAGSSARVTGPHIAEEEPLDGEIFAPRNLPDVLHSLVGQTTGDLLWLRPDQWDLTWESQVVDLVARVAGQGRRVRVIYPLSALSDSPVALSVRVQAGEEIRLAAQVPTRMLLVGNTHALLPEPLGTADSPRLMVRQRGLVEAMALLFDELWRRASPLETLQGAPRAESTRRFLLEQLAQGAQDEQIARRLGLSLRTVRRRVADVMAELGAESRFQAGVEAARRGWL